MSSSPLIVFLKGVVILSSCAPHRSSGRAALIPKMARLAAITLGRITADDLQLWRHLQPKYRKWTLPPYVNASGAPKRRPVERSSLVRFNNSHLDLSRDRGALWVRATGDQQIFVFFFFSSVGQTCDPNEREKVRPISWGMVALSKNLSHLLRLLDEKWE